MKIIVIRADATPQMGTGHIMRCFALAQAWQDRGGEVFFVMVHQSSALEARLILEGIKVIHLSSELGSTEDALQTTNIIQQLGSDWAVIDGYHFGAEYQKVLKHSGVRVLAIDDYGHAEHYSSDLVLNQNLSAHENLYQSREPSTHLLLGLQYVLLRREFRQWQWQRVIAPIARKILVTLGGSDPDNVTLKVIKSLKQTKLDDLEVIVVVGGSNPHYEELQSELESSVELDKAQISLQRNVSNMPELMAWADIAIAAGGSTSWELAFMGLPSLVITVAENQKAIASKLDAQGYIIHIGWHQQVTPKQIGLAVQDLISDRHKREMMSRHGQKLVDGNGVERILEEMKNMLR
jgi:UDP-2,4-diacetamido-2,4,6-trideoxy-beta-L-altropyranose hydrolase